MQRRKSTKELIADSFIELTANRSVDKIKIKEIVANCGLTPTTFYNHFQDKYDLIVWIYSDMVAKNMNRLNNDGYELRDALFDGLKYSVDNRQFLINAMMHTNGQHSFADYVAQIDIKALSEHILKSQGWKELPNEIDTLIKVYCFGIVQFCCEWLINRMPIPIEELVNLLEKALPEPLKKYLYKSYEM